VDVLFIARRAAELTRADRAASRRIDANVVGQSRIGSSMPSSPTVHHRPLPSSRSAVAIDIFVVDAMPSWSGIGTHQGTTSTDTSPQGNMSHGNLTLIFQLQRLTARRMPRSVVSFCHDRE
jgi:hypothetical protein